MSSTANRAFSADAVSLGPLDSGTSILLTGDDEDALRSVFFRLVAPDVDERSVVLATNDDGRTVRRVLDRTARGSGDRLSVLAGRGPDGDGVRAVEDLGDLTKLGMEFTSLLATAQTESQRFRSGILLCSRLCEEVDDMRSVYRLLNTNFLSDLRRGDGIGVCALDTSADVGANMRSIVAGMSTSFTARIDVEVTGPNEAALAVSGLDDVDETMTVSL